MLKLCKNEPQVRVAVKFRLVRVGVKLWADLREFQQKDQISWLTFQCSVLSGSTYHEQANTHIEWLGGRHSACILWEPLENIWGEPNVRFGARFWLWVKSSFSSGFWPGSWFPSFLSMLEKPSRVKDPPTLVICYTFIYVLYSNFKWLSLGGVKLTQIRQHWYTIGVSRAERDWRDKAEQVQRVSDIPKEFNCSQFFSFYLDYDFLCKQSLSITL